MRSLSELIGCPRYMYPCYLTQAVLGCIGAHVHCRQVTSSCDRASQRMEGLLEAYFRIIVNGEQENNPLYV